MAEEIVNCEGCGQDYLYREHKKESIYIDPDRCPKCMWEDERAGLNLCDMPDLPTLGPDPEGERLERAMRIMRGETFAAKADPETRAYSVEEGGIRKDGELFENPDPELIKKAYVEYNRKQIMRVKRLNEDDKCGRVASVRCTGTNYYVCSKHAEFLKSFFGHWDTQPANQEYWENKNETKN